MKKIGIVEDDRLLNEALSISLGKEGYEVLSGFTCQDGFNMLKEKPDILLLDINLPDGIGFTICRQSGEIPIIFLTARDDEIDMIKAYDFGCEDYIVKPFSIEVLKRRIQVVLRRETASEDLFQYKTLAIDYKKKQVSVGENIVKLTAKEYRLLEYLSRNTGQVLSKEMILQEVWDIDGMFVVDNTVSVTVNRLKKKIEPDPAEPVFIKNIFGMGYVLGE